jgi:hypothetical protein
MDGLSAGRFTPLNFISARPSRVVLPSLPLEAGYGPYGAGYGLISYKMLEYGVKKGFQEEPQAPLAMASPNFGEQPHARIAELRPKYVAELRRNVWPNFGQQPLPNYSEKDPRTLSEKGFCTSTQPLQLLKPPLKMDSTNLKPPLKMDSNGWIL